MSVAARLISGSAASWMKIGITMISQIALVPLYLNYWSVETYGVWLAVQALIAIMTIIDMGHQTYLGYEFLKVRNNTVELSKLLWSGASIALFIGVVQLILILIFIFSGLLGPLLDRAELQDETLIRSAGIILFLQGISWLLCNGVAGLFVRALEPFGYFPRMAWWGVFLAVLANVSPALAVVYGADLITTCLVMVSVNIIFNVFPYLDMFRLMRREKISFVRPSLKLGYKNFLLSTAVTGKLLLENARQQGVRLVLAPLAGAVGLAAFSTMRTGSNVALQGLNTITNPLMPDLMRFLHDRDQIRSESAFGTIWIIVVALMAPAVVILQAVVAPLFELWTNGRIVFDPALFSILSLGVLVYAIAQPAMAVVMGNNLMRPQLLLSGLAAVIVIGSIIVLIPVMGILGAGISLLLAEVVASFGYKYFAKKWLRENSLSWPSRSFRVSVMSVFIAGAGMGAMIYLPQFRWGFFAGTLILLGWNFYRYWKILPDLVTQRALNILRNTRGIRRFIPR